MNGKQKAGSKEKTLASDGNNKGAGRKLKDTPTRSDLAANLVRIQQSIASIKKELKGSANDLKSWANLADLYAMEIILKADVTSGDNVPSTPTPDQVDTSFEEYLAGYREYQEGNFDAAEAHFLKSVDILPWNILSRINLGNLHFMRGNYEKAEITFKEALNLSQGEAKSEVLTNLGMNAIKAERPADAERFLVLAIEANPANAYALNNLGLVKESQGSNDEALVLYKKAVIADRSDGELWYNLGNLIGKTGKKSERLFCFMEAEKRGFFELKEFIDDLVSQGIKPVDPTS
nr:tetratricopeptide repeat protein [Candidatus Sigynarchaeota archaeon]